MSQNEETIPNHYVQGFRANLNLAPQQLDSRLLGCVDTEFNYATPGTSFNADDVGASTPRKKNGRAEPSPDGFLENIRRGGHFEGFDDGKFLSGADKARMLSDPSDKTMKSMSAGKLRFHDDKVVDAMFGNTYSGENLTTVIAFDDAKYTIAADDRQNLHDAESVAASGDLGLTLGKIITASTALDRSEIEGDRFFAFSSWEKAQLLASTPATSSDYAAVKALVEGKIDTFMGFKFVRTERLPVAAGIADCAAWVKPAICFATREIVTARITQRADRSYAWYAYYEGEHAACRRYDQGVIKVRCKR